MQAQLYREPILDIILCFEARHEITALREIKVLNEVVGIHKKQRAIDLHREVFYRVYVEFLCQRHMLGTLNTHRWTCNDAVENNIMRQKRIGFFRINLLVVRGLVKIKRITRAIPNISLRGNRLIFHACRHPRLQVGAVAILLKHIEKVAL